MKSELQQTWILYFAGAVHMNLHPGAGSKEHQKMTLDECEDLADEMLIRTIRHFKRPPKGAETCLS